MKALVFKKENPGRVSLVIDYPEPELGHGEVLIRVKLAGICSTDLEIVKGYMGFEGVLGHEFVGKVVDGPEHLLGHRVVGGINCPCFDCDLCKRGLRTHCRNRTVLGIQGRDGVFAEYCALPATNCHIVPEDVKDEEAVFAEPLAAALQVVRHCAVDERMRVAVLGSGRMGLLIAQVLEGYYCDLTVIGRNPASLELAEELGLKTQRVEKVKVKADHDVVVEATGSPEGFKLAMQMVRPLGTIVLKSTYASPTSVDLSPIVIHEIRVLGNRCGSIPDALSVLDAGKIETKPLISATFPLSEGVRAFEAASRSDKVKVLLKPDAS